MPRYSISIMRFDKVYDSFFECDGDDEERAIEKLKTKIIDAGIEQYYILDTAKITDTVR